MMYIIKNAFRCIARSKGRNILIGIIALVIAVSACIGLSIRQAAESAKASALEDVNVTATIQYDRAAAMGNIGGGRPGMGAGGGFDRDQFAGMMENTAALTLEEYKKYAAAESVKDFNYTLTAYLDGSDDVLPVSEESEDSESLDSAQNNAQGRPNGMGGAMGGMGDTGDFSLVGYSSDSAMTSFVSGNASIVSGAMFEEGASEPNCVISEELAMYNSLAVGDTVTLINPSLETESYVLTVVGIYTSTENNDFSMSVFGASQDPANRIYMSANALQCFLDASASNSTAVTDENGRETESKIVGKLSATYSFATAEDYYAFAEEVRTLGLDDAYTVSSADITAFETSITPLNTLSKMAGWFLIVILGIGGVILVVLNIFNVRERKYEVGVLTAMGMKKWKVATQFVCEILVVTMLAVVIGAGIGAVTSVPVTNALLEGQIESQSNRQDQMDQSFGRPGNMGEISSEAPPDMPENHDGGHSPSRDMFGGAVDYITEVNSAMNLTVVLQMIAVGILLTLITSAASVLFIMRYDPLKILANRD